MIAATQEQPLADALFMAIQRDAIRADGLAVWVSGPTEQRANVGSVGPSLYDGTAGIALALAYYGHAQRAPWAVGLAVEAARHAYALRHSVPRANRWGLFGGWSGIALALAKVANVADDAALFTTAKRLLGELKECPASGEFDIVSGDAGAVGGLAIASTHLGDEAVALAAAAAERLSVTARPIRSGGRAWRSPRDRQQLPLTGFAHGTAGVAWALLTLAGLHVGPSADGLTELAEEALHYEDGVFMRELGNWPDLRHYPTWKAVSLRPPQSQVAWCHGAPGIALARLAAFEKTRRPGHATAAKIALRTTMNAAYSTLGGGASMTVDALSVCHGLAGLRSVLVCSRATGSELLQDADETIHRAAARLMAQHTNSGLMCGRAGVALCVMPALRKTVLVPLLGGPSQDDPVIDV